MRIGFDAKRLFNNFTGLGNYSRFVVDGLIKFYPHNEYTLFTPKIKSNPDTQPFLDDQNVHTVLPAAWLQKLKLGSVWRAFGIGSKAKDMGIDLYHGLSQELPYNMPKMMKSVVTVHDLIFLRYPQFYNPIDVSIYKAKVKHACRVADKIVAISEQTSQDIVEFLKINPDKITVVYQGCHPNFKREFTPQQLLTIKQKYNLPSEFILNVGTIEARKNALLIVKALNKLKDNIDTPLVIVGKATPYLAVIKAYASVHDLSGRIKYIHQIPFEDLPAIYRLAKVFVYPSLFEGFGIPLVEAISCEVPVITSTGSCFKEAAGPNAAYINPEDEQALADQLKSVLNDKPLRANMISQSTLYIKKFQPEVIAKDINRVYTGLLVN